jgi:predicted MFS family arabinose efflux permease
MGLSFGTGGVIVATQVMLTPSLYVGRAIAVVQAAQPIAGSIGPPLGALVIPYLGVRGLYLADAGLLLGAAAALALLLPEPVGGPKPTSILGRTAEVLRLVWVDRQIRWSLLNQALSRGAVSAVDSFLPVRIVQIAADPAPAIGWILGSYGALTTLATWLLSRIADRLDVIRVYTLSMLLGMVLAAAIASAPWLWLVAAIAVARAIPTAFSRPLLFLHLARVVPTQQQTAVFALLPTAGNLGGLVLPLATSAIATYGVGAALMVGSVGHALSAAAGLRLRRLR